MSDAPKPAASPGTPAAPPEKRAPTAHVVHGSLGVLSLGALGIVFGDIGTSPLYTLHECTSPEHGIAPMPADILGVLSLIFWSLTMVVTVKYLTFIMRADNHGEGGIFALLALIPERMRTARSGKIGWVAVLVIIGAALLYGDGMITPAISVLSAMEGLEVATPSLKPLVIPITCAVLVGLFAIQRRGTGGVGALFGPVMVVWFLTIGGLGTYHLFAHPAVLAALNPLHGARFFLAHGTKGFLVLGSVVLAVTGGEALYADMGHFGSRPIRVAWLAMVMPALVLCYFGQGALMLTSDAAKASPFFAMVPPGRWTYALVVLSTMATVIASQALISGAFSLTHQAVQLGFFPRVTVKHTSRDAEGQIYVPEINWALAVACVALVIAFKESSRLAAAYGIAVTGTMAITSIVYFEVTRTTWKWPIGKSIALLVLFLSFDLPFFAANLFKFIDGGYVPVLAGAVVFVVMINWKTGRRIYREHVNSLAPPFDAFLAELDGKLAARTPGTGIFMAGTLEGVPAVLVQHVERLHVLPKTVLLVTVVVGHAPYEDDDAMRFESLGKGFYKLTIDRGFMDATNVPRALEWAIARFELPIDLKAATYYLSRETFLATSAGKMGAISESLFAFLARNARPATALFCIPPSQVIEIGSQIDL